MPRPKRTKITSATTRVATAAPRTAPAKHTTTTRAAKGSDTIRSFSDDSDGLVVKSKTTRPARRMPARKGIEAVDEADLIMTGALPAQDVPLPSTKNHTPASNASKRIRAMRSTRTSASKPSPLVRAASPEQFPTEEQENELAQDGETSGYGDLTLSSFGSESVLHGTRPPSAMKIGATPGHEASILALTNFKRRARQPSLLRMVQQTTDMEDNDQIGLDDMDDFDFDDFMPEAESTPLNLRKNAPESENRNDSGMHVSSSGSRGTKRKLSPVVQVPRSSPPFDPPSGADLESARSSSPSLPEVLPSHEEVIEQTQDSLESLSETFAPPMSSSPVREVSRPVKTPAPRTRARGRPPKNAPQYVDSDSEETETPAKAKRNVKSKSKQAISTAQLKGLLPRRRNRALRDRDEFDFDSSEATPLDSDQDELQMPNPRSKPAPKKSTRGKKAAKPKLSKTYSRRISSDKENNGMVAAEEVTEASIIEHSEKLAAIKKKFEEVDAYELEFEDVSGTMESSSPFR